MSLSAPVRYSTRPGNPYRVNSYKVRNGTKIYYGALVAISTVGVTDGKLVNWSSGSGALRFVGVAIPTQSLAAGNALGVAGEVTGNSAGTNECPVSEGGDLLENVSVTGATSAQVLGDPVYASDENTFTLTATSNVGAVGVVARYISSGKADVQLYSKMEYAAMEDVGQV